MELSSWPQIPPINQKNYYTYVAITPLSIRNRVTITGLVPSIIPPSSLTISFFIEII